MDITQETGIRQGCPFSPYLFLIVMTTMFIDVKDEILLNLAQRRVPGADFDEVMYAEDIILIREDTKTKSLEAYLFCIFRARFYFMYLFFEA